MSLGGSTAFYEIGLWILSQNGEKFAAHLPIYPGTLLARDNRWSCLNACFIWRR